VNGPQQYTADGATLGFGTVAADSSALTPVLLLHGLGGSAADWDGQLAALRGRRLIIPDLRGFGSNVDAPGPYTIARCAADVALLLDHLQLARVDVVGHSMGGAVALQLTLDHPEHIRRLVLVNSVADFRVHGATRWVEYGLRRMVIALFGLRGLSRALVRRNFPRPDQVTLRAALSARYGGNRKDVYLATMSSLVHWSVASRLDEVTAPTLVVSGEHDIIPMADKVALADAIRDAELVVVPGSRHATPIGAADRFNELLLRFLDGSPSHEEDVIG